MNEARTIHDDGFHERINRIVNRLIYGQPPESDEDPLEKAAALLVLRWEMDQMDASEIL